MFDSLKFMEIILNDNFLFLKKNIRLSSWNIKNLSLQDIPVNGVIRPIFTKLDYKWYSPTFLILLFSWPLSFCIKIEEQQNIQQFILIYQIWIFLVFWGVQTSVLLFHPRSWHPLEIFGYTTRYLDKLLRSTWYVVINNNKIKQVSKVVLKFGTFFNNSWYDALLTKRQKRKFMYMCKFYNLRDEIVEWKRVMLIYINKGR